MRTSRLDTRITQEQRDLYERAVLLGNYPSLTEFLRDAADKQAHDIIEQHEKLILSQKDKEFFIDLLLAPPSPNEALLHAATNYEQNL